MSVQTSPLDPRKICILSILCLAIGVPTLQLHPVHAAGSLSIDPSFIQPDPTVNSVTLNVRVDGMDQFNAWYIEILTDPTALNATSFTVTNQFPHFEGAHCINGDTTTGSGCVSGEDRVGVVHSEVAFLGAPPPAPLTGVLFTIIYHVGINQFTNIHFLISRLIVVGSPDLQPTVNDGAYGTPPAPDFTITSTIGSLSILPNEIAKTNITVTSIAGFTGRVNLTATVDLPGLSWALKPNNVTLDTTHNRMNATFSAHSSIPLDYAVNVTGTANVGVHYALIDVSVKSPGYFTVEASPSLLKMPELTTSSTKIAVRSQYNFLGDISLSVVAPQPPQIPSAVNASLGLAKLHVNPNGYNSTTLTISIPASAYYFEYRINVTAVSGSAQQVVLVKVTPPPGDLRISASVANLVVLPGGSAQSTISVTSIFYYVGPVYLQPSMSHGNARMNTTYSFVQVGGTIYSTLNVTMDSATDPGTYAVLLTIYTGTQVAHSLGLTVTVSAPINTARQPTSLMILGLTPLVYYAILGVASVVFVFLAVQTYRTREH